MNNRAISDCIQMDLPGGWVLVKPNRSTNANKKALMDYCFDLLLKLQVLGTQSIVFVLCLPQTAVL